MVAAFVRDHVAEFVKSAGTTDTYATTSAVPAGNLLVMALVHDNAAVASKPLVSSISVAAGESASWLHLGRALSTSTSTGAFADGELWCIKTTVNWASGTSLTVTYDTTITMKAQNILEFSGVDAALHSGLVVGTNYSTTTTAASAVTSGSNPSLGDLVVGLIFGSNVAAAQAGDTDTTGAAWSTPVGVGSTGGSGATNNFGIVQYKIPSSSTLHQTLNNSAAMTAGNGAIVACLAKTIDPLVTQAAYQIFGDGTETGSTALATQSTAPTVDVSSDANVQVRVRLQETAGGTLSATTDWRLQWDKNTSGGWTPVVASAAETLTESWETVLVSTAPFDTASTTAYGQTFKGEGETLTKMSFALAKVGTPVGTLVAELWAHTGTYGSTGKPTGTALATSTNSITASTLTTSQAWVDFTFAGTYTLVAGTPYVATVRWVSGTSDANWPQAYYSSGLSGTHEGNQAYYDGAWGSAAAAEDLLFRVYGTPSVTNVVPHNSASLTDAAATTRRLTVGTGSFIAGKVSEDGLVDDFAWSLAQYTELLYAVTLKSADLADADSLRFRVLRNGLTTGMTYTVYPTITVSKGPPPPARDRNIRTSNPALSRSFTW